jgi:hypothetical protein
MIAAATDQVCTVFASLVNKVVIMKVIVSLLLVIVTMAAIWGAGCMVDFTVHMMHFLQ